MSVSAIHNTIHCPARLVYGKADDTILHLVRNGIALCISIRRQLPRPRWPK